MTEREQLVACLQELGEQDGSEAAQQSTVAAVRAEVAAKSKSKRRVGRRLRRGGASVVALIVIGLTPPGQALGEKVGLFSTSEEDSGPTVDSVPAAECPKQAAMLEKAGRPVDVFAGGCPDAEELQHDIRQLDELYERSEDTDRVTK